MSHSAPWNSGGAAQGSGTGQIKFYDPTKFQADSNTQTSTYIGQQPVHTDGIQINQPGDTNSWENKWAWGPVTYQNNEHGQDLTPVASQSGNIPSDQQQVYYNQWYGQGQGQSVQSQGQYVQGQGQWGSEDPNQISQQQQHYWQLGQDGYSTYNQAWNNADSNQYNLDPSQWIGNRNLCPGFENQYGYGGQHIEFNSAGDSNLLDAHNHGTVANTEIKADTQLEKTVLRPFSQSSKSLSNSQSSATESTDQSVSTNDSFEGSTVPSLYVKDGVEPKFGTESLSSNHTVPIMPKADSNRLKVELENPLYLRTCSNVSDISNESLRSYNNKTEDSLSENEEADIDKPVERISNQMANISLQEKEQHGNNKSLAPVVAVNQGYNLLPVITYSPLQTSAGLPLNLNQSAGYGQETSKMSMPYSENQSVKHAVNQADETVNQSSQEQQGFGDWEMVQTQGYSSSAHHSREGSLDNNVHFFIGSEQSSSRNTPSKLSDSSVNQVIEESSLKAGSEFNYPQVDSDNIQLAPKKENQHSSSNFVGNVNSSLSNASANPNLPPPSHSDQTATPPKGSGAPGDNPFRKAAVKSSSRNSSSQSLSSTTQGDSHLQRMKEADQLLLNQSISPIPRIHDSNLNQQETPPSAKYQSKHPLESKPKFNEGGRPHLDVKNDLPVSTSKELAKLSPESPIMPRKESPFQPPPARKKEADSKRMPVKASHDLLPSSSKGVGKEKMTAKSYIRERLERDRKSPDPDPILSARTTAKVAKEGRSSALQSIQLKRESNRLRHNVSPATTLWDTELSVATNILLCPTVPDSSKGKTGPEELTPVVSLISSLSNQIQSNDSKGKGSESHQTEGPRERENKEEVPRGRDTQKYQNEKRRKERDASLEYEKKGIHRLHQSMESLDQEVIESTRDHKRSDSRERESYDNYYGNRYYRDRGGYGRGSGYDRPPSRSTQPQGDYLGRSKDPYYRRDEQYDRPRSRQAEDRPSSRNQEIERPRSRTEYERDYNRDNRYRGYDYDYYQYYDSRYYDDYYYRGYYDETGYYHRAPYEDRYAYRYQNGVQQQEYDRYSQPSRSRVNTPGSLSEGGDDTFQYPPELKQGYGQGNTSHPGYDNSYYYDHYYNRSGYDHSDGSWLDHTDAQPRRQTPERFLIPHLRASFGPGGQLVKVLPNRPTEGQPASVEIYELESLIPDNEERDQMKEFPGPLVKNDTHKNDVVVFCQKKAKACADNINMVDRESAELIWKFLELLIKQNGIVVGTDIADLLLEGHEPTTHEYSQSGVRISHSMDNLDSVSDSDVDQSVTQMTVDRSIINKDRQMEDVTDRFRHLLLYGRKKDALEWAMKNKLWGHALFLASKMDTRTHATVMTRFANVAMRMNDPLQTLYQLMSGRQPAAVTCIVEETWGDWRPHLAMILSNQSQKPDLDRKSITSLGDTLAAKGYLYASHFCYMMSQIPFGSYNKKSSKIVLVGSSHSLPLEAFASNEAIQCTEIYEYALALGNTQFSLIYYQYFKFLYATRLVEYGYPEQALQYFEVISRYIHLMPGCFQPVLVKLVYELANQLKFYDVQRLQEGDDAEDPEWLTQLYQILQRFEEGSIQPMSGTVTPMGHYAGTTASSESGEVAAYTQGLDAVTPQTQMEPAHIEYQQSTYGGQGYQQYQEHQQYQQYQQQGPQGNVTEPIQQQYWQAGSGEQGQATNIGDQQGQQNQQQGYYDSYQQQGQGENQWQAQQPQMTNQITAPTDVTNQGQISSSVNNTANNQNESSATIDYWAMGNQSAGSGNTGSNTQSVQRQGSIASTKSFSRENSSDLETKVEDNPYLFTQHRPIIAPKLRKRTISETSTDSLKGSATSSAPKNESIPEKKEEKAEKNAANKATGGGGGLFGGFFRKLMPKPKNEMILPDDKNPSIIWDPVKKRWANTDDDSQQNEVASAPPPKDIELKGSKPPGNPPQGQGRAFSKGARQQYVDVLNPKPTNSASVPSSLFNVLPSSQSSPAIFVPGGARDNSVARSSQSQNARKMSQPVTEETNQIPDTSLSENGRELSIANAQTQQQDQSHHQTPMMLFNPAQFQGAQEASKGAGTGNRLTQRRTYPK
ncbi:hypothetical protein CHS0354_038713 [Potamilus streckersoni]|uniref:Protein transport protein sec16 n=1 Tax=Potamilus streckersoni TaxID=2493646 RepID=A0AAE0VVP4_9BIVA|nr:hypothetical protein CHS0354_038713 [Potamilus streckersoni]